VELGLYTRDWVTTSAYALILSLCAPLWEELLFRGFLLPSLAKRWPPGGAAAGSALVFALLHSQTETFAPLVLVGLACGWLYVGTNNLLPSMVYHGLWNLYVMGSMGLQMHAGCEARTASLGLGAAMAGVVLAVAGLAAIPRVLRAAGAQQQQQQQGLEQGQGQSGGSSSSGEQPSAA
jgi:membrane protease YdiL (CAAX protease family)